MKTKEQLLHIKKCLQEGWFSNTPREDLDEMLTVLLDAALSQASDGTDQEVFSKHWFLNGGGVSRAHKYRDLEALNSFAQTLPKLFFDYGCKHGRASAQKEIERLKEFEWKYKELCK